jgi:hypothetical protein
MNNELIIQNQTNEVSLVDIRKQPERFPRLGKVSFPEAMVRMQSIIHMASMYMRADLDKDSITFMAQALITELLEDKKYGAQYISFEEISRAVKKAVLRQGKEMYGLSVSSLYACIIDYIKTEGHDADKAAKRCIEQRNIALDARVDAGAMMFLENHKLNK